MRTAMLAIIACCTLTACQTGYAPASFQLAKPDAAHYQTDHTRAAEPGENVSDAGGLTGSATSRFA